jgi:hypothetical protein
MLPHNPQRARITRAAMDHFKKHPFFPRSQVNLRQASIAMKSRFPVSPSPDTDDAADCALEMFRIHAEAYLPMVENMSYQDSYRLVLGAVADQAIQQFSGGYPASIVALARPDFTTKMAELVGEWVAKGYERLAEAQEGSVREADSGNSGATNTRTAINRLLSDKGLTPNRWAELAGVDPKVVYGYMDGKSNPRADSRKALAEAIGLKPSDLP